MNNINDGENKEAFPTIDGILFIKIKDISFFRSDNIYSILVDIKGNEYFVTKSLKVIENKLKVASFFRIHKSYLINTYNIFQYCKKERGCIVMECETKIPVSRNKKPELLDYFSF